MVIAFADRPACALDASTKLQIGLEIDGPAGSDWRLVAIGMSLEALFGRLPPPGR